MCQGVEWSAAAVVSPICFSCLPSRGPARQLRAGRPFRLLAHSWGALQSLECLCKRQGASSWLTAVFSNGDGSRSASLRAASPASKGRRQFKP